MTSGHKDKALRERAARVMPGGLCGHQSVLTLPDGFPQFFERAEGCHLWDVDGTRYVDFMCAYGPNLFGYRHPAVEAAARAQMARGDVMTGPAPVMVELAEALVAQVTHADWAMFCKNGTDATTMALMIARAHTGRRKILVARAAYHGSLPWCTPIPNGVTAEDRAHLIYVNANDRQSLSDAVRDAGDDLAGIIASPYRYDAFAPSEMLDPDYARDARAACDRVGALLILDEVRAGFRLSPDGSWSALGVEPDLSAWGKAIANGHGLSCLLGSDTAKEAAASVFVTGSFWYAAAPMAASLATLNLMRETDYLERIRAMGERLRAGLDAQARAHGFALRQTGPAQMPQILFEDDPDFRVGFAWAQEAVARGAYIHPWHNMFLCTAHGEAEIDTALAATDQAFEALKPRLNTLEAHPFIARRLGR